MGQLTAGPTTERISKVRTACSLCQNFCGLLAYRLGDNVIKLEGDPDNPHNHGHACAKGLSGHFSLYSPNRIRRPMIRTNPEKGLHTDPRWKTIGWDEAMKILVEKVTRARARPGGFQNKVFVVTFDYWSRNHGALAAWCSAMQAFFGPLSAPCFCGNAVHPPSYLNTATFEHTPDAEYAKYLLLIGAQAGSIIHYDTMNTAKHIAEKRPGAVKVVVVDPLCSYAASKAEEWIPIRPGTDTAFILALVNLLVNDYGIYDAQFLKQKTNAPYLVGPDGLYVRDPGSRKPLVWDTSDNQAKPFDTHMEDPTLEGTYTAVGVKCAPAFQKIKDHVRRYSPEQVSEITTVPADTIRRIARELGDAASIGSTIKVDGVELPYRPVSIVWYRGLSAHRHSYLAGFAAVMLPTLLGAIQVPGGIKGNPHAQESVTEDGLMAAKIDVVRGARLGTPYPPRPVRRPVRPDLYELFPVSVYSKSLIIPVLLDPQKFGLNEEVRPELMIIYRDNFVANTFTPDLVAETLRKIPYIVAVALEHDESTNLADLVIPDLHHLERLAESLFTSIDEPGYWYAAKPVVKPPFDPPYDGLLSIDQLFLEVAKRAGFLNECYDALNDLWHLRGTGYELDPSAEYPYRELIDRRLKSWLDPDAGLSWLLGDEGGLRVWSATPEERYRGAFRQGRIHLYYEFMIGAGREVDATTKAMGLPWDTADYQPIPDWKPCLSYSKRGTDFDLFVINYKVPVQVHGVSRSNPILRQLTESHGSDPVLINPKTAQQKEIRDGDEVMIETVKGRRATAVARLSERVHPEVLATMQRKLSKGAEFNDLVTLDEETVDFVGCAVDSCLLARVTRSTTVLPAHKLGRVQDEWQEVARS